MTSPVSPRNLAWLAGAVALSGLAAAWRWPDSAHAMAVIRPGGGAVRHPVVLPPGADHYQVVLTAPVVGAWRGDARLSVEGEAPLPFDASLSGPVVDLGFHHWPRLEGAVIRDLVPGDRIALWVSFTASPQSLPARLLLRDERDRTLLLALPVSLAGKGGSRGAHH